MPPPVAPWRLLVAVLTTLGTLVTVTPASAVPAPGGGSTTVEVVPQVSPTPQELAVTGPARPVPGTVRVTVGRTVDQATVTGTEEVLRAAGATRVVTTASGATGAAATADFPLTVHLTASAVDPDTASVLRDRRAPEPGDLPAEGYVLAAGPVDGRRHAVLAGADPTGTYYALQTLRQLLVSRPGPDLLPAVAIRDWPATPDRGTIEGFYGTPWSQADRLRHLDFAGAHKLDTYVYAPKDDPWHRERWREPYPAERLAEFAALAERARLRHVDLVFAVSPGQSVCHSDDADFAALTAKTQALHDVGVRSFALFFDDIAEQLSCPADRDRFGADRSPSA
ncbi:MAG TPA: beta-N-acetylglucosaminidase domain-containing protein, partial [Micromonospora sp.]